MKKGMGLWIDHREAIIVTVTDDGEEIKHLSSGSGKHLRYSGSAHSKTPDALKEVTSEDRSDRKYMNNLNSYYDEIFALVREAESIQIFGPGEAKGELEKRLEHEGLKAHILTIETVDKMTEPQIVAKVREHFQNKQPTK